MASCKVCLSSIKKNQLKVMCSDCNGDFHAKCVKVGQADIEYMEERGCVWRCDPCGSVRRKSIRLEYGAQQGTVTLDDVMKTLREIQDDQKQTVADFNKSYSVLREELEGNTATLGEGMKKIENYMKIIDELRNENSALKTKVESLESRVEDLENYSRRNCLEIQGVPEERGEVVADVVRRVGRALEVDITDDMVDVCHRFGMKTQGKERGIIVKFVRRMDKDTLMKKRREKKDFSTRHMDLPTDTPVYLNDSLSPARRRLLAEVRRLRREKGFKYLWLRNGNILLRREEGSPVVEIRSQADLSKL